MNRPRTFSYTTCGVLEFVRINDDDDDECLEEGGTEKKKKKKRLKKEKKKATKEGTRKGEIEELSKVGEGVGEEGGNRCCCQSQDTIMNHGPTERGE